MESIINSLAATHPALPMLSGSLILILVAIITGQITKRLLLVGTRMVVKRSRVRWDDALVENNVFGRLSQIVPASIIGAGIKHVPGVPNIVTTITQNVTSAWMLLVISLTLSAMLGAASLIYHHRPGVRPIHGLVQFTQIVVYVVGGILVISALLDRSPLVLLSGMGALSAVAIFIFKDMLVSAMASLQMSAQDMVRVGDWIEAPQFGADGNVTDIELFTVKVQNWDKTITMIPTSKLVYDSFRNWRGMSESGGRRIKRSLYIDLSSIQFLSPAEVKSFDRFTLLKDHIAAKQADLKAYNDTLVAPGEKDVNLRRLTNIGMFRAYLYYYLKRHPKIHQNMMLIVRQLQPGPDGLPIEIYCYTNDIKWANYEGIQSDIFDHALAIVPEFALRVFQQPGGPDIAALVDKGTEVI